MEVQERTDRRRLNEPEIKMKEGRKMERMMVHGGERGNRQLMDCLLEAVCGMSTNSHLHEQAPNRESMSQPLVHTHTQKEKDRGRGGQKER